MAKRASKRRKTKRKRSATGLPLVKIVPWNIVLIVIVCAGLLAGAGLGLRYFFLNSRYFNVREIVINQDRGYSLLAGENKLKRLYAGKNIFAINLKEVQRVFKRDFPQLKQVEVRRDLPDTLEIDIISRDPVAVIDSGGGFIIDKEGVVLAVGEKEKGLVEIKGISFFLSSPSRGEKIDNQMLDKALVLIDGLRRKMRYQIKNVEYVDISNRNNIMLNISGVPVKMGTGNFSGKINKLAQILNDPNIALKDINYIDLRFEEAVISPK